MSQSPDRRATASESSKNLRALKKAWLKLSPDEKHALWPDQAGLFLCAQRLVWAV